MRTENLKGYIFAAIAAAAYGTNPIFAVPLYMEGMNPNSVLFFRYLLSLPFLAAMIAVTRTSFRLERRQIVPCIVLGILMALSSLLLFESYRYMSVGVASTLLFVYPIMVAVLMILFFHERFRLSVGVCLILMSVGLALLMNIGSDNSVSLYGCMLVMLSALSYALYMIMVNESSPIRGIPAVLLLFYVVVFGVMVFLLKSATGTPLTLPATGWGWANLIALAIIPTVISFGLTTRALQLIGSTPTAILGALEPVSAVLLGVIVLGQGLSLRECAGGALILLATLIVVANGARK